MEQFAQEMPDRFPKHFQVGMQGLNDWVVLGMEHGLYLLLGGVALQLVIVAPTFPFCCWRVARCGKTNSPCGSPSMQVVHASFGNCSQSPFCWP
jgi:hypothetical protein